MSYTTPAEPLPEIVRRAWTVPVDGPEDRLVLIMLALGAASGERPRPSEIVRNTGLTPSAVAAATGRLMARGLVGPDGRLALDAEGGR